MTAIDTAPISDEKLEKLTAILEKVGLPNPDHYGFQSHIRKPENYTVGPFEWTEHSAGTRFYIYASRVTGEINHAEVVVKDGRKSSFAHSEAEIAVANAELRALFA